MKETWAAIVLQRHCRGYLVRSLYQLIRVAAITLQAHTRGLLARRKYRKVGPGLARAGGQSRRLAPRACWVLSWQQESLPGACATQH